MLPPNAKVTRLVDAAVEPLSLAEAKQYLRMDWTTVDDAMIADFITAARLESERINDRSFLTTSWRLTLDFLPFFGPLGPWNPLGMQGHRGLVGPWSAAITLPMPPLLSLTSIRYVDLGGVSQVIDVTPGSPGVIVSAGTPGRIAPGYGQFFPFAQPRIAAVDIDYTAGYGPDPGSVPKNVKSAMRLLVSHYYEHRTSNTEVPDAVVNLLDCTRWS